MYPIVSLHGRRFAAAFNSADGQVGQGTVFSYWEDGELVLAEYSGGAVRHGRLVGTRRGDTLDFRYVHIDVEGVTSTGHCTSRIESGPPVRLHETWEWESKPGSGTSVLVELPEEPDRPGA